MTENSGIGEAAEWEKSRNIFSLIKKSCLSNWAFLRKNFALDHVCFYLFLWLPSALAWHLVSSSELLDFQRPYSDQITLLFLFSLLFTTEIWPPVFGILVFD